LAFGGFGIIVGLATYGKKVIETIGQGITEITPTRGFAAEFGAAFTIMVGSSLGLPLSTTQVLVGCVIGVGLARGIAGLNINMIRKITGSWLITIPATASVSALFCLMIQQLS
jgi:phosphate/sulfate permease